jgi:hypothetical protein
MTFYVWIIIWAVFAMGAFVYNNKAKTDGDVLASSIALWSALVAIISNAIVGLVTL